MVDIPGTYSVTVENVVSFKLDDVAYIGNLYSYKHASSSLVKLKFGKHMIYVNTLYDVRISGGYGIHLSQPFHFEDY